MKTPEELFSFYCKSGRQDKPLLRNIKAVISKPPKGITIDEAAKRDQLVLAELREIVQSYYSIGLSWHSGLIRKKGSNLVATRSKSPDEFVKYFKGQAPDFIRNGARSNASYPVIIGFEDLKESLILGTLPLAAFSQAMGPNNLLTNRPDDSVRIIHYTGAIDWGFMGVLSLESLEVSGNAKDERGPFPHEPIHPLTPVLPLESHVFVSVYTMLIPGDVQNKIFAKYLREDSTFKLPSNGAFIKDDGTFDISSAVRSRDSLWELYIKAMTSVKEAQTDDPQIILYQVSLDLNPFCAYGRPIKDMITN
jgi:hypothetical protein